MIQNVIRRAAITEQWFFCGLKGKGSLICIAHHYELISSKAALTTETKQCETNPK